MLNKLKKKIESYGFTGFANTELLHGELVISAGKYTGYLLIKEMVDISEIIDSKTYDVEFLNDNIIKVRQKNR